jgi:hypothetical protein
MKKHLGTKVLAAAMSIWLTAFSCTAWITTVTGLIDAFLPAAANIALLVASIKDGSITPQETQAVQSFVAQVEKGTALVRSLVQQYNAADATAKPGLAGEIQTTIATINANLAAILQAIHINNPATQQRVSLAVGLLLAAVVDIAAAIPGIAPPVVLPHGQTAMRSARLAVNAVKMRNARDFKKAWNALMSQPTGNTALDNASAAALLK